MRRCPTTTHTSTHNFPSPFTAATSPPSRFFKVCSPVLSYGFVSVLLLFPDTKIGRGELARLEKRWVQTQTMVSSSQTKAARFPTSPGNDSGLGYSGSLPPLPAPSPRAWERTRGLHFLLPLPQSTSLGEPGLPGLRSLYLRPLGTSSKGPAVFPWEMPPPNNV